MVALEIASKHGEFTVAFEPTQLIIAGWTGRDERALEAHIAELAALGVARPRSVPIFYRVSIDLLTSAPSIEVAGSDSTGEVEAVLWKHQGELYVGVGSDHTDRKLEAVSITLSKQVCAKPVSTRVWRWREVADHWDEVVLRSVLPTTGDIYQHGSAAALRRPDKLLALYEQREGAVPDGTVMFCGTLPVHGAIRFADAIALSLEDGVLGRRIDHGYAVQALSIVEA